MPGEERLLVSELFHSIQGESSFAGMACAFIRLSGCNLRCTYCDARYTSDEPGRAMGLGEILDFVRRFPSSLVEVTGGEPLLQDGVYPLMEALLAQGRTVLLETNGSLDLVRVPAGVRTIVDVKCPGSGMSAHIHRESLGRLAPHAEVKCVLSSREDYDWAVAFLNGLGLLPTDPGSRPIVHFSPVAGRLDPAQLASWILTDRLAVRLQLQLHKILWPGIDRGV